MQSGFVSGLGAELESANTLFELEILTRNAINEHQIIEKLNNTFAKYFLETSRRFVNQIAVD